MPHLIFEKNAGNICDKPKLKIIDTAKWKTNNVEYYLELNVGFR